MAAKFTLDQRQAIDQRACNILVSAAAGSGKTTVLVERIVEIVCDKERGVDIDRLLVVTFTKAAAAQMRERLIEALTKRLEAEINNSYLQRQLLLVHNAQITTIDSFCLYLIRNHFNDIGLDPDFRTVEEGELRLLSREVLSKLLEEKFEEADPAFLRCVESFSNIGEKKLEELVLQLYEFAMSHPWPKEWLLSHSRDYQIGETVLEEAAWYRHLWEITVLLLQECKRLSEESAQICASRGGPWMYAQAIEADLELLEGLSNCLYDEEKMYEALREMTYARLSGKKDVSVEAGLRERVKKNRERMKALLEEISGKFFYAPRQVWMADLHRASPALEALAGLTLTFIERLEEKKRDKNLLDFHDMEHLALDILLERQPDGSLRPTRTAREYRTHFHEILIDEYQDSNLVQELLLQSISGEEEGRFNRFMVGDVKQSIYKFRMARPELFMEKYGAYRKVMDTADLEKEGQQSQAPCLRVDLKENFRSRPQLTACVNDIFSILMHSAVGGVEYDEDARLNSAAAFPQPEEENAGERGEESVYEPELLLTLKDSGEDTKTPGAEFGNAGTGGGALEERNKEAWAVAGRIRELVGRLPVRDRESGQLRPARYGDIVILLRTAAGWDEVFREVLTKAQIPVHVTAKTGYFAAGEVQALLQFLRILHNPLQDIPLFGVLHSCIGNFNDVQIARLRALDENGKCKLYHCLEQMAQREEPEDGLGQKCADFLCLLGRFREYAVWMPVHNLLARLLEETGYLYTVSAMPGGSQRRLNVEMLLAKAEAYEKSSYTGLFHFIRYMEQLEKYDVDFGVAGLADENADIVRIMSIHKSKGLEFPICFVCGLSKRFNLQDSRQTVIWDMDLGLACDCIDPDRRTKKTALMKNVLAKKLQLDSLGEELRVLYVAMTRAAEKMILTASCKQDKAEEILELTDGKTSTYWEKGALLPEGNCYLDWLAPLWGRTGRPVRIWQTQELAGQEIGMQARSFNAADCLARGVADCPDTPRLQNLKGRLDRRYGHDNLANLFVKTTVSELKRAGLEGEEEEGRQLYPQEEIIPYLPRFVQKEARTISGSLRGSAYHRLLELFPFEKTGQAGRWSREEIVEIIEKQQEQGRLRKEYAVALNPQKLAVFLESPLAKRMHTACQKGLLWREQPFVLGLSADKLDRELPKEETVLIQGIIDVFFEEDGALVLVDYKTDRVEQAKELTARYRVQLDYYEQALCRLTGMTVKERILYSFALQEAILV